MTAQLDGLGKQVVETRPEAQFDVVGFDVRTFGGQHALIHPSMPTIVNVGYLVDELLYHPGDSFAVPPVEVKNLLVPIHAPWSKMSEVVDFVVSVRAEHAHQIHDGLLNPVGLGMVEGHVSRLGAQYGTVFRHLDTGEQIDLV